MPILIVLMFLLGIDLNKKAFTDIARNPKAVYMRLVGQLVALPVIAFAVAWVLKLPPVYFMGLVLIACCPGGSSSNVFSIFMFIVSEENSTKYGKERRCKEDV